MRKSTAKDVRRFLAAFADVAVDNNVKLLEGCWRDKGRHCLLGELVNRANPSVKYTSIPTWSEGAAELLGITWKDVDALIGGWDGDDERGPFGTMGLWLRARYLRRWQRKEGT